MAGKVAESASNLDAVLVLRNADLAVRLDFEDNGVPAFTGVSWRLASYRVESLGIAQRLTCQWRVPVLSSYNKEYEMIPS